MNKYLKIKGQNVVDPALHCIASGYRTVILQPKGKERKSGVCDHRNVIKHNQTTEEETSTYYLTFIKICHDFAVTEKSRIAIPNNFRK